MTVGIEEVFKYCPRCGEPHPQPGAIPFRCGECGFTMWFGPVAAVGGLILNDSGEMLLVRRARDPGKGMWGLPGGFVDRGETVEEALTREVTEETSLRVTRTELLVTYPNEYNYHGVVSPVIDLFYLCHVETPVKIVLAEDELESYEWTVPTKDHLANMAFPSNRRAIEYWLQTRSS